MGKTTQPHWSRTLPTKRFAGQSYLPQVPTHGTLENDAPPPSVSFLQKEIGLKVVKLSPSFRFIKHPGTPWYIVYIRAHDPNRPRPSRIQRLTVALATRNAVHAAHRQFTASRESWKLRTPDEVSKAESRSSFLFADFNGNWWGISIDQA